MSNSFSIGLSNLSRSMSCNARKKRRAPLARYPDSQPLSNSPVLHLPRTLHLPRAALPCAPFPARSLVAAATTANFSTWNVIEFKKLTLFAPISLLPSPNFWTGSCTLAISSAEKKEHQNMKCLLWFSSFTESQSFFGEPLNPVIWRFDL